MKKTVLDSDQKLKELKKTFDSEAEALGLLADYLFVTQYRAYIDELEMMDKLKAKVQADGVMIDTGSGMKINPAVSEYNKMAGLASKTSGALLGQVTKAREAKMQEKQAQEKPVFNA